MPAPPLDSTIQRIRARATARCVVGMAVALLSFSAEAQVPRGAADSATARIDARSPRAAVEDFLALTRRGHNEAAAQYLGGTVSEQRAPELARRLRAVLDQQLWLDLAFISPSAFGDTTDGMVNRDQIGAITTAAGVRQAVQVMRAPAAAEPGWVFAPETVRRIDLWYDALPDHWIRDRMPEALMRPGPFGVERWQWATLVLLFPIALALGWIFGRATVALARRLARRTDTLVDDHLLARTGRLVLGIWTLIAYRALAEFASLSVSAESVVGLGVRAFVALLVTWLFVRVTYVLEEELPTARWAAERPEMRSMVPLVGRVSRIFLVAIGGIAFIAQFGYSVVTLVTGLGIGGIALALAAQKTLEHMFGSVAIGLDQPIRVGDWIRVGDTEGEVEAIGLRSTRIRTMARSLVVIPNGRLADMQMENFGVRDRILIRTTIGLEYGTSAATVMQVRDGIERLLNEHPLVWRDQVVVRLRAFGASALELDVIAWIETSDMNIFRAAREEIYLRIMHVVESCGASFAFPTQTINVRMPPG